MKTGTVVAGELFDDPVSVELFPVARVDALLVAVWHDDDDAHVALLVAGISRKLADRLVEFGVIQIGTEFYLNKCLLTLLIDITIQILIHRRLTEPYFISKKHKLPNFQ